MGDRAHEETLGTKQVAERLGISPRTAARWCAEGRLPGAYKIGEGDRATWRVPVSALAEVRRPGQGDPEQD